MMLNREIPIWHANKHAPRNTAKFAESGSGLPIWIFPEKPFRRAELTSAAIAGTNASSANVYSDNFI